jgi:hypothetical protein
MNKISSSILEIQMFDEKPVIGPLNWYLAVVNSDFVQELRLQKIVPFRSNL